MLPVFSPSLFLLLISALSSVKGQECSMCSTASATIANPDRIIPFLSISGESKPSCQTLYDFGPEADEMVCKLVQGHAAYCGCPESSGPVNVCSLCPNPADSTTVPDFVTPFEDTCGELEEYISYMSEAECESDRVRLIQRNNWLCKCPNSETLCSMCPDNTVDLAREDLVIPFFNTPINNNPSCREIRNYASLQDPDDDQFDCALVQEQAGFCGCPDIEPLNICTFCPDGSDPANSDLETPTTDTCDTLNTFHSYFDSEGCDGSVANSVASMGFVCGCPGVEANCELCDGTEGMGDPNKEDSGTTGLTCGDLETVVSTLTAGTCESQAANIQVGRSMCCVSGALALGGVSFALSVAAFAMANIL
jgi:hypothetical protein